MSEKRFSVRLRSECDEVIYSFFDGDKPLDLDMIVDLLNELYGEMKRFGEHNYKLEQYNLHYLNENTRLKEENEQLRQQLQEYKENWDDMVELATKTSLRNVELDEQIGRLQREN